MLKGNTNAEKIVNYLMEHGLTEYAAYGMVGNIKAESGLNPINLQNSYEKLLGMNDSTYTTAVDSGKYGNFANDQAGYGLCQWTSSGRKAGLLAYARKSSRSIGDMEMQLEWLLIELSNNYKKVLSGINSAKSIREASDIVLTQFERPKDQSENAKRYRANCGETIYAQIHGNISVQPVPVQQVNGYQVGKTYTLQANMYVRQTPNGEKIKFDSFTQDAKKHGHFDDEGNGILNSGTRVTCKAVEKVGNQTWLRIPSGWVCAVGSKTFII